jgi:ATP-dependent DNA helicase RecG
VPRETLYLEGGVSVPRNPNLQKMFQLLGLSDKAGTGFPKILRAWKEQNWRIPKVSEDIKLEMTKIILPLISMIPEETDEALRNIVGEGYTSLSEHERIILALAHHGEISNVDIQPYVAIHPRDISEVLRHLVQQKWLFQSGYGRGTSYCLADGSELSRLSTEPSSEHYEPSSEHYEPSSEHYEPSSEHYEPSSEHYEPSSEHYKKLEEIAVLARQKKRLSKEMLRGLILDLCSKGYLTLKILSKLLERSPDSLRNHYINPMITEGLLEIRYPNQPSHPNQAYRASVNL